MLALLSFILAVVETDPNLLLGAALGGAASLGVAIINQWGAKPALARIEAKLDHLESRVDNLYTAPKPTTKIVSAPSGETVVTVAETESVERLIAQADARKARQ